MKQKKMTRPCSSEKLSEVARGKTSVFTFKQEAELTNIKIHRKASLDLEM